MQGRPIVIRGAAEQLKNRTQAGNTPIDIDMQGSHMSSAAPRMASRRDGQRGDRYELIWKAVQLSSVAPRTGCAKGMSRPSAAARSG